MTAEEAAHEAKWIAFMQSLQPTISPHAVRLMGDMRRVGYALQQIGQASIAESGLSHSQYQVLMNLYMQEQVHGRFQLNPSEISRHHGTSRNTISSLIRGLEKDGLIERHLDEEDRRKFNICLTDNGRSLVSKFAHEYFRIVGGCFNTLSAAETQTLSNLLAEINTNLTHAKDYFELQNTQSEKD